MADKVKVKKRCRTIFHLSSEVDEHVVTKQVVYL